jgi:hypothetical protein
MNEKDDQIAHFGIVPKCVIVREFRNSPWTASEKAAEFFQRQTDQLTLADPHNSSQGEKCFSHPCGLARRVALKIRLKWDVNISHRALSIAAGRPFVQLIAVPKVGAKDIRHTHYTVNSGLVSITVTPFHLRSFPKPGRVLAANIPA